MIRRCVDNLPLPLTLGLLSQAGLEGAALSAPNSWDTTARVPPFAHAGAQGMIRPGHAISLPAFLCNRNRSTPKARFRSRAGNFGANARPLP
jgi:hypothetical protein